MRGHIQTVEGFKGNMEILENKGILPPDQLGVPDTISALFSLPGMLFTGLSCRQDSPEPTTV